MLDLSSTAIASFASIAVAKYSREKKSYLFEKKVVVDRIFKKKGREK